MNAGADDVVADDLVGVDQLPLDGIDVCIEVDWVDERGVEQEGVSEACNRGILLLP